MYPIRDITVKMNNKLYILLFYSFSYRIISEKPERAARRVKMRRIVPCAPKRFFQILEYTPGAGKLIKNTSFCRSYLGTLADHLGINEVAKKVMALAF